MLFILTGDIQIGKTRWLQRLISGLEDCGVTPYGVIAPGTWIEHVDASGNVSYEKTGIDNELLPQHERIPFARRVDLALAEKSHGSWSQAQRAQLAWAIEDDAISRVNEHLDLISSHFNDALNCDAQSFRVGQDRGLLVIDELGRLELLRGEGLTSAMRLLDAGATDSIPHALVIVREQLLDCAFERFAGANWGGMQVIGPNDEGESLLREAYAQ